MTEELNGPPLAFSVQESELSKREISVARPGNMVVLQKVFTLSAQEGEPQWNSTSEIIYQYKKGSLNCHREERNEDPAAVGTSCRAYSPVGRSNRRLW